MASSVAALSWLHHHLVFFKLPSLSLLKPFRTSPAISCFLSSSSSSSSSSSLEFDISFAPSKPKPEPHLDASSNDDGGSLSSGQQIFIPWIVRGEDGNLRLQDHPPARLIHALADAKTQNSEKNKEKQKQKKKTTTEVNSERPLTTAEQQWSKAARRFYNENLRVSPQQRLSKVPAAAGGQALSSVLLTLSHTGVDPARDVIYVNGNRLPKKLSPKVYPALNKPKRLCNRC